MRPAFLALATLASIATIGAGSRAQRPAPAPVLVLSPSDGFLELDPRTGVAGRVVHATHASVARYRDATRVVFLVEGSNELRELDLATGQARTIATLPGDVGLGCGGLWGTRAPGAPPREPYLVAEQLQFATSMAVDADRACFEVMDRNLNMASVVAQIEVDLHTSAVRSRITWLLEDEPSSCTAIAEAEEEALPCTALLRARARAASTRGRARAASYTVRVVAGGARGLLVPPSGPGRRLAIVAPSLETISPDGRWGVLGGNPEEGDYIYRSLWLVDLVRGRVFGLAGAGGEQEDESGSAQARPWPAPLPARVLADAERIREAGFGAAGETSVRWMGDALVLGETVLVRPGRSIVRLPGPLVW